MTDELKRLLESAGFASLAEEEETGDTEKKVCSIVWDGLKDGPRYNGKDKAELDKMTTEFLEKHGSMKDPEEFGQAMRDFAEERGYEVEDNVYLDSKLNESMSEAVEKEFLEALHAGEVEFKFKKKDGTTREARGTLKPELMDVEPKATDKKVEDGKRKHFVPPSVIVYWDLGSKAFRSFRKDNFISWEKPKKETKKEEKAEK